MSLMEMKMTYYHGPPDNPSVISPDTAGPFIAPCQQEAVTEQTLSSLSLTAVRVVTERRDLKDRPGEVKKTLLLPRERSSASERHPCLQAMQKKRL
jgi:hypothetical protein